MSLSPLPHNYGYLVIKPLVCPTILGLTVPTKMNHIGPDFDLPRDPNILPLFTLVNFDKFIEFDGIEIA
jgi:hypothetical protein